MLSLQVGLKHNLRVLQKFSSVSVLFATEMRVFCSLYLLTNIMKTIKIIKIVRVKTVEQIKEYIALYKQGAGLDLDSHYLSNAHPHFIYINDALVAAYTLNNGKKVSYRYLSIFNEEAKQQVLTLPYFIKEDSFAEIAAIAMTPKSSEIARFISYILLMMHAFFYAIWHKRPRILGGSVIPQIQRKQFQLLPNLLYKAPIDDSLKIVNTTTGFVMLYYATRSEFIVRTIYLITKELLQLITGKPTKNRKPRPVLAPAA